MRETQSRVLRHLRWSAALVMWLSLCLRKQAIHWGPNYHPQNKKDTNKEMKQKLSWECKRETIQKRNESIATSEVTLNHATHLFLSRVSPFFLWWEKPHSKSLPLQAEFWAPGLFTVPPYWQFFRLWCCFSNLITKTGSSIMALEMHLCHVFKFLDR